MLLFQDTNTLVLASWSRSIRFSFFYQRPRSASGNAIFFIGQARKRKQGRQWSSCLAVLEYIHSARTLQSVHSPTLHWALYRNVLYSVLSISYCTVSTAKLATYFHPQHVRIRTVCTMYYEPPSTFIFVIGTRDVWRECLFPHIECAIFSIKG